jgi:GT2 family glycosyltransferase
VTHNRAATLEKSFAILGNEHQVVVVDSGSTDSTPALEAGFPDYRFVRLARNFGLTRALNIGIRASDGKYVLILHDDARIAGADITKLADYLESHPEAGAVAPLLTDGGGNPTRQIGALPTPAAPEAVLSPAQPTGVTEAQFASSAAIMFRMFFLKAMRHIDERYGTWGAEAELCQQVRRAGKKLIVLSDVKAVHECLPTPLPKNQIEGDRAAGISAYLGKHHGFLAGTIYRLKTALIGLITFHFSVVSAAKIDGGAQ